jgi:hypothetical protein
MLVPVICSARRELTPQELTKGFWATHQLAIVSDKDFEGKAGRATSCSVLLEEHSTCM